jgi:hypothetical protein
VTGLGRDILRVGTTYYLYSAHWDGTTQTVFGTPLTSIGIATTTDFTGATFVASPLITGWSDPSVSEWGGAYHMVARNLTDNAYYYVRGTSPTSFDFSNAVPLHLAQYQGAPGAWDSSRYAAHGGSGEPRITTTRVVDGVLYMFYAAGTPLNGGAVGSNGHHRGLGVLRMAVN